MEELDAASALVEFGLTPNEARLYRLVYCNVIYLGFGILSARSIYSEGNGVDA